MFRFIEFWMGMCYIKPSEVDTALMKAIEDYHQSQAQVDASNEEGNESKNLANSILKHVSSQEALPSWLREQGKLD